MSARTCPLLRFAIALCLQALLLSAAPAWAGINDKNGNFYISYTDVQFSDEAMIVRTYNSKTTSIGIFGFGWSSDLEHTLYVKPDGDIEFQHNGGGRTELFRQASARDGVPTWVDPFGNAITRDDAGYTVQWKRDGERNRFDLDGRLLLTEDQSGERVRITYRHGVISRVVLDGRHRLDFTFYSNGKVKSIQPAVGSKSVHYRYNFDGDLISSLDVGGNYYLYEYDQRHNMTAIRYTDGSSRLLSYNDSSYLVREDNEKGCLSELAYGSNGAAPDDHYWTLRRESCDGVLETHYLAEFDYRPEERGAGYVIRYWFLPDDFRPGEQPEVQYSERVYNSGGMMISRETRFGTLPAMDFDDPI